MKHDPVIIGGGPAGMAAAAELGRHGVKSILLDDASRLGGVVYRGPLRQGVQLDYLGTRYRKTLSKLHTTFAQQRDMVDVHSGWRVVGEAGRTLVVADAQERLSEIPYDHLVVATGCHERSVPFPGWTLPGIMLLGGLQLQIKSNVTRPHDPVVITGTGPLLPLIATQLHRAGAKVVGVFEACAFHRIAHQSLALANKPQPLLDGLSMLAYLKAHSVPFHYGWGILDAAGDNELQSIRVAPYRKDWSPIHDQSRLIAARTLGVGYGFLPRTQLTQQIGLDHTYDHSGYLKVCVDHWQRSSSPMIHVAGDTTGIRGGEAAIIAGRIAALSILLRTGAVDTDYANALWAKYRLKLERIDRFYNGIERYTQIGLGQMELPDEKTVICRCEHTTRHDIDRAIAQGVQDVVSLKMRTRAGMGDCQGRMCIGYCSQRLQAATKNHNIGWLRPRFPIDPVPMSSFQRNADHEVTSS